MSQNIWLLNKVEGKGEGLFTKKCIEKGKLWALYAGILVPHYLVDRRRWEFNSNTIEADSEFSIDVPSPFEKLSKYCASLGHKANHSFHPNSKYIHLFHPKFGDIMSVEAIKKIKKGEEITVNYGYAKHSHGPEWFRAAKKKYQKELKELEKKEKQAKRKTKQIKRKKETIIKREVEAGQHKRRKHN